MRTRLIATFAALAAVLAVSFAITTVGTTDADSAQLGALDAAAPDHIVGDTEQHDDGTIVAAGVDEAVVFPLAGHPTGTVAPADRAPTVTEPDFVPVPIMDEEPAPAPEPDFVPVPIMNEEPAPEPEPEPEPAPAYASGSVEDIIARHFGRATQKAIAVARCESTLNPSAVSPGGGNHGLFQINNVHAGNWPSVTGTPWSSRYDAEANTVFAKWLYDQQGWGPWACA